MRIYLTNLASDVTGYKLALIDTRNPKATSTPATAVTTIGTGSHSLTAGGKTTAMTLTAGGSAAKWITKPLLEAITVPALQEGICAWALNGSTVTNTSVDFEVSKYTTSLQTTFAATYTTSNVKTSIKTNKAIASTTAVNRRFGSVAATSTSFAAGNRIAIVGTCVNAYLTSKAAQTAGTITLTFDGSVEGSTGDTYITIPIAGRTQVRQQPTAASVANTGKSVAFYQEALDVIDALTGNSGTSAGGFTKDANVQSMYDQIVAEQNNL